MAKRDQVQIAIYPLPANQIVCLLNVIEPHPRQGMGFFCVYGLIQGRLRGSRLQNV